MSANNIQWQAVMHSAKDFGLVDSLLDAIDQNQITAKDAKVFLSAKEKIYALDITQLESSIRDNFLQATGMPYPEKSLENLHKMAGDTLIETIDSDKEKFGPSFTLTDENNREHLVVTAKALQALNIRPERLTSFRVSFYPQAQDTGNKTRNTPEL